MYTFLMPFNATDAADRTDRARMRRRGMPSLRAALASLAVAAALYLPTPVAAADADVLLPLLEAEFAFQQGDHRTAAVGYVAAARASRDVVLSERAARIALLAGDEALATVAVEHWQALAPESNAPHGVRAQLAMRAGDTDAAIAAFDHLLSGPGDWRQVVQVLGARDSGLATAAVLAALADSPRLAGNLDALLALGGLALQQELDVVARRIGERLVAEHPQSARAWLWVADAARRGDDTAAALAALERVLAVAAGETPLRLAIAAQFDALGDPHRAAAVLAGVDATGDEADALFAGRAAYLARADDRDGLAALYAELRDAPERTPARAYLLGQLAEVMDDPVAALAWYDQVPSGETRDRALLRIAILQERSDEFDAALGTLHALQTSDSDAGEVLVDAYLLEAELLRRRGQGDPGIDALNRGLLIFEDEPTLLYARALAFERLDRVDEAIADLRRLVDMDPDNADALNALGYTLADRTTAYDEAYALVRRALELRPESAAILDSMGWVLHRLGRSHEALLYLQRSFALQPDAEVAAHLGEVLWRLGRRDEAAEIWNKGRELDADNRALQQTLERFAP